MLELTKQKTVYAPLAVLVSSKANALFSSANKDEPQFASCKYCESHNGKEAVNGLGDVKTTVFRNITVNRVMIDYVKPFAEYANQA